MGSVSALDILFLLLLLQVKHAVCDGPLQTLWMLREKGFYGKPGGLAHAGIHGLGSLMAFIVFGMAALPSLALALADSVVHYHVDFTKETVVRRNRWSADKPYFWWALTADQMVHQFTYVALAAAVIIWV